MHLEEAITIKKLLALCTSILILLCMVACDLVQLQPESSSLVSSALSSSAPSSSSAPPIRTMPQQNLDINMLTGLARPEGMLPGQRPVAITVANNLRALPQRGISAADVVFEMETEAGITRLMALFADYNAIPQVGPVRSTRDQFAQFALSQNAIPVHIGTSIYTKNLLSLLNYKAIDGIQLGTTSFYFDAARALPKLEGKLNEYCWYTDASLVWSGMEAIDVIPTGDVEPLFWFADTPAPAQTTATSLHLTFSQDTDAIFTYNPETGLYYKDIVYKVPDVVQIPHADEDGTQLAFTNVLVLTCPVGYKADGYVTDFDLSGGTGYYFTAGGIQEITWEKGDPMSPLRVYLPDGNMLQVQRGKTYIGVLNANIEDAVLFTGQGASTPAETPSGSAVSPSPPASTPVT